MQEVLDAKRPRYVEAFLRLEAASAVKLFAQGMREIAWHDQGGEYYGTVHLDDIKQNHILIRYTSLVLQSSGLCQGEALLPLVRAQTNPAYHKPYFCCPRCGARIGLIVLAETWACRRCHRLGYRSQYLTPAMRQQQRLEELTRLLRPAGRTMFRPRHMREARFAALKEEYTMLRQILKGQPRATLHAGLSLILMPHWSTPVRPAAP